MASQTPCPPPLPLARTVLLPSEDAEAYETHLLQYLERLAPVGERETELVQSLADTQWRLRRQYGQDLKELQELQRQRRQESEKAGPKPSRIRQKTDCPQTTNGFELSKAIREETRFNYLENPLDSGNS